MKLISEQTSKQRFSLFQQLMDEVVLPQRRRLLQYRDHTWQSAYVDSDGVLAELISAIVTGTPGSSRKGKTGASADLSDGTEVKKGYRLDPNIDFVLEGSMASLGGSRVIILPYLPDELQLPDIRNQLNANASSVQLLKVGDPADTPLSHTLGRTVGRDALVSGSGRHDYLRLTRGAALDSVPLDTRVRICVRQERGHINFGARTRDALHRTFSQRPPVLVFYQHDPMGRPLVAVLRVGLRGYEIDEYLDRIFAGSAGYRQVQPYLLPDNDRGSFYLSEKHSAVTALRCDLLALGVETASRFEVVHWGPDTPSPVAEHLDALTEVAPAGECPPFSHSPIDIDLGSEKARRQAVAQFYESSVAGWYDSISPYCDQASVTRNIGLENLAQHLVSLRTGIRGTRSGARGADLVEEDGGVSEVKLATGEPTGLNPMKSTDVPRLNLGADRAKLFGWRRLFPVRICDRGAGLEILLHAPSPHLMDEFRQQVADYFVQFPSSINLQYHALGAFPSDSYGVVGRTLSFARVAWLKPDGRHEFWPVP